ncbi:uncharacterized protein [Notamacropus eugenii]|uniref:uncharacterized protein n=1 Tax=Notamacropus eugenii TaxID=9315 RepID=UPI003B679141
MPNIYFLRIFFMIIFIVVILNSLLFYWMKSMEDTSQHQKPTDVCRGEIARGTITPLENSKTFIIAPYFDKRYLNLTRIIGIIHQEEVKELYCWFCCQPFGNISIIRAGIDILEDNFGFPYGAVNLLCSLPQNCNAQYVSIHWSPNGDINQMPRFTIRNQEAHVPSSDFTVCISPMFANYKNVLQFIQSMEMYKILGAQTVMIYKTNCSQLLEKVLEYYVDEGTAEVISWPITSYLIASSTWLFDIAGGDIGYYGQVTALNDCIYRNMYRSHFVVLNDIDEILLPIGSPDWKTMMRRIDEDQGKFGVFMFMSFLFPNTLYGSHLKYNISSWTIIPGVDILKHIYRETYQQRHDKPKKLIVKPQSVIQISVHRVPKSFNETLQVSPQVGFIYHCRYASPEYMAQKLFIRDDRIWNYGESLIQNVNVVLKKVLSPDMEKTLFF